LYCPEKDSLRDSHAIEETEKEIQRGKRQRAPIAVNGTVPPRRVANLQRRPREYLTVKEVELLMEAARKRGRHSHRDATMILVAFRHGLRPSEVCTLRWDMADASGIGARLAPAPAGLAPHAFWFGLMQRFPRCVDFTLKRC
jgi:integrase